MRLLMKRKRLIGILGMAFLIMAVTMICSNNCTAANKNKPKLSKTKLTLRYGDKEKYLSLKNAKSSVRWSSSNTKVVGTSFCNVKNKAKCALTVEGIGKSTITAKCKEGKFKCKVTVKHSKVHESVVLENALSTDGWPKNGSEYYIGCTSGGYFQQWKACVLEELERGSVSATPVRTYTFKLTLSEDGGYSIFSCRWYEGHKTVFYLTINEEIDVFTRCLVTSQYKDLDKQQFILSRAGEEFEGKELFYIATPDGRFVSNKWTFANDALDASKFWLEEK